MIYVGIDDTDIQGSPGTNKLARFLIENLQPDYPSAVAIRHQLLFDPRVPYTSKNSSAALLFRSVPGNSMDDLIVRIRQRMQQWFVAGSDPGLCVTKRVPEAMIAFGQRCKREIVTQAEARRLAAEHGIHLEGLGGTEDGVIGALAAVGLAAEGNDGRVVSIRGEPDDLSGVQEVERLLRRGVAEIRCADTGQTVSEGQVDVGKHLRPSWRGGRIVLYVRRCQPAHDSGAESAAPWCAVRLL